MLSGYDAEQVSSIEAEDALADEFCEWVRSWQTVPAEGSTPERVLSGARLEALLGMGRIRIISVMNNRLRRERGWRQANHLVRQAWLAKRERWLLMGLPELEWEEEERKRREKAAARGAEAEDHDDDAPYAVAGDVGVQPASGVSGDSISDESSSPGVTGSPQEEGVQPDAEQPDEDGVDAPVNAPAEDVDAEDEEGDVWAEAAGADLEEMVTIIDVRNAQKAFSIEVGGRLSDTIAPRSPSGATSV